MTDRSKSEEMFDLLRKEAEELVARAGTGSTEFPDGIDNVVDLIHELKVSHAELEIQNEELREAQLQVESVKSEYQNLYDSAPVGYVTLNSDAVITRVNATATTLLRRRRPLLLGGGLDGLLTAQGVSVYRAALQRAAVSRSIERADLHLVTADHGGEPVWVQADIRTVMDEDAAVTGWLVTLIDMTDRKRAEEANRRAEAQALLNREVHHRVKNDIMLISSFLYLEEERAGDQATEDALARARRRIATFQHVYSALQNSPDADGYVNAGSVLKKVLDAHSEVLADHGATLDTSLSEIRVTSKVALSLGLIANELLTNAEKHALVYAGEPHVRVHLRPEKRRTRERDSRASASTSRLRLIVTDNGQGFPDTIFDQEVHSSFGLSVVQALSQQHDGSVSFSNDGMDGGARTTVTLACT